MVQFVWNTQKLNKQSLSSYKAFTVVTFQVEVLWVAMPCSIVVGYQCFRGPCYPCLQGEMARMGKKQHRYRTGEGSRELCSGLCTSVGGAGK